jgi:hypothetical protein
MELPEMPFTFTDWNRVEPEVHPGETGSSRWRIFERNGLRVRVVEYSPGFRSDHWCPRGHVLFVLKGRLTIELKDGAVFEMPALTGFQAGNDKENPHLASTVGGATVFIVD